MTQNEQELEFLSLAIDAGEKMKRSIIKEAKGTSTINFIDLRRLDMDIKLCKDELGRSKC